MTFTMNQQRVVRSCTLAGRELNSTPTLVLICGFAESRPLPNPDPSAGKVQHRRFRAMLAPEHLSVPLHARVVKKDPPYLASGEASSAGVVPGLRRRRGAY
jgi:hypothetical protein